MKINIFIIVTLLMLSFILVYNKIVSSNITYIPIALEELGNKEETEHCLKNIFQNRQLNEAIIQEFTVSSDNTKQQAWKILQYAANLDPDFIGMDVIKKLFPENIELSSNALKKLEMLSLISIINNQNNQTGFKIHRKLQVNIQNLAKNHPEFALNHQKIINHLLSVLDQLFLEQTAISLQPHVEKLLNTEIKAATEKSKINLANLYYKLAKYYSAININYQVALKYAKTSLVKRNGLYKDNHPDIAHCYHVIGVMYRKFGNTQEGLKYLEKGLEIRQQLYSGDHPDIADSFHTIGNAYNQHGEIHKGFKYSQMALDMNQRLYSGNHYEIGCSLNAVGISYLNLGDFKKSLKYLNMGLKMLTELNPINYEKIAALQSNIAYNYNKLGNHIEALKHAEISVDIFKKLYPDGHPRAIYSLDDFGDSLIRTNNIKKGLDVLHQALILSEKFSMGKHFITAFVLQDLGSGYFKVKDYRNAIEYTEMALNLRKELYSNIENHYELAESLHVLGDINLALGNKNKGLKLYKESLKMYTALLLEHLPEAAEIKQKINTILPNI
jgi:tetratricopeptide (TPR) repeat protein